jgi:flagellar biosynthetic protein FlhB
MADEDVGQERTEAPTPRRREEARRQGQIAVSADLNTGVQLLAAAIVLAAGGQALGAGLLHGVRADLYHAWRPDLDARLVQAIFAAEFGHVLRVTGVLLGTLFLTGVLIGLVQSGFAFYPDILSVRWEKLDPSAGLRRLVSGGSALRALTSLLKVAVMAGIAYAVLRGRVGEIRALSQTTVAAAVAAAWDILLRLFLAVAAALLVIGLFDYVVQRVRLERRLRMTRQEAKEELRKDEGDPQIRARIRRLQREAAQRRMLQAVPQATVVITNPTHLAVALRYDRATMSAPKVVAAGAGFVAERILELARRHGVPVVPNAPLAQALYRVGKLDQEIPAALYQAAAEVLAFVYRMRGAV